MITSPADVHRGSPLHHSARVHMLGRRRWRPYRDEIAFRLPLHPEGLETRIRIRLFRGIPNDFHGELH